MEKKDNKIFRFSVKKNAAVVSAYVFGLITIPILTVIPSFGIKRPPANVPTDLVQAVLNITNYALGLAISIATLMIMYAGVLYMVSGGNEEAADRARKTLANAIVGIIIMGLAYAIVNVIVIVISAPG